MTMRAEGECPLDGCDCTLGVQIGSSIAAMMGDTIKSMLDKDGNAMRCPEHDKYVEPVNIEIVEDY